MKGKGKRPRQISPIASDSENDDVPSPLVNLQWGFCPTTFRLIVERNSHSFKPRGIFPFFTSIRGTNLLLTVPACLPPSMCWIFMCCAVCPSYSPLGHWRFPHAFSWGETLNVLVFLRLSRLLFSGAASPRVWSSCNWSSGTHALTGWFLGRSCLGSSLSMGPLSLHSLIFSLWFEWVFS